jgi:2,5-diketo-D-gluconate reductase A
MTIPQLTLSNGVPIPALGFGTYPMRDAQATAAVRSALQAGYRLIDTAENYGNEAAVGLGLRQSGVPRQEVFVTTKFNRAWHSVEGVRQAATQSLERLGLDYLDLLLIHWPNPDQDRYVAAFEGLLALREAGIVHAVGTSNFKPAHLERLLAATGALPQVNQINLNPWASRPGPVAYHQAHAIVTESWSPLGRATPLDDPVVGQLARAHQATPAQVVLRWHIQHGYLPIPKSADPARQRQNLDCFGMTLSDVEMAALDGLDRGESTVTDSDIYGH